MLAFFALFSTSALRAEIEFVGILATSQSTRFALVDTASGHNDWVTQGGAFAGYTVRAFDAKDDTLTLARDGAELRVKLKDDAKVQPSRLELRGTITFGTEDKIEVERATLQCDQENVFPLKDGITYRITPTRREDGTIRYAIAIQRAVAANRSETVAAPSVIVFPGRPFSVRFGDELAFAFTPR